MGLNCRSGLLRALAASCVAVLTLFVGPEAGGVVTTPVASGVQIPGSTSPTTASSLWQTTWTSPMDFYGGTAVNASARDIAPIAVSGTAIELRLSNLWSGTPTTFGSVTVGIQQSGASVVPGSTLPVTFANGSKSITIPANQDATSDPIPLTVHAGNSLAVSLWVVGAATVSVHYCCDGHITSYATRNNAGDLTNDVTGTGFTFAGTHVRWLSSIQVSGTLAQGTVVAFGDSITEGYEDAGFGWPTPLQQRIALLQPADQVSVVDEGISGNTLTVFPSNPPNLTYALTSGGYPGITRLSSDALLLPGTKDVVLFIGTNDIWFGGRRTPALPYGTAASIIGAMQSVITQGHTSGKKIFGVTLLPRATEPPGPKQEVWTAADQSNLEQVNAWIRGRGAGFDGVIDLAAVVADVYNGQCSTTTLFGPYNSGDNLHPSNAGQVAMANAIPTTLFQIPEAPQLPPPVVAVPTPGCPGAAAAEQVLSLARASTPSPTTPTTGAYPRTSHPTHQVSPGRVSGRPPTTDTLIGGAVVLLLGITPLAALGRRIVRNRSRNRPSGSTTSGNIGPVHRIRSVGK